MLLVGVALAGLSFVAVLALGAFGQKGPAATPPPNVSVVIAAADLPLGTQVTADKLATTTKPQTDADGTFQDPAQVVGKVVRRAVPSGVALTNDDFATNVSLPDVVRSLQPGLRAIAVPLSRVDSVGALVQPGDSVDVLISMEDRDNLNPIAVPNTSVANPNASPGVSGNGDPYVNIDDYLNNTSVKVVVQNVQVLAAIAATPPDSNSGQAPATPQPDMVVLLAVTPQQAEIVRFAQLDGNVSLVLRSPADSSAQAVDTTGITLKQLVDQYGVLPPAPINPAIP
jgi:Flp pilus assembly protein CpaB